MKAEVIQTLHPVAGKTNKKISLEKYTFIKEHILTILSRSELTHTELMEELYARAHENFDGGVQWYGETVKLDLEARQIIKRTKTKPEKYKIRAELKGGTGALMDEYGKAIAELINVIRPLNEKQLCELVDITTTDLDCQSIQTILTHVVCSGYGYIIYIENYLGDNKPRLEKVKYDNVNKYIEQLNLMLEYSINFFQNNPNLEIEQMDNSKKINVNWGQQYDIEQLLEHAIVHILRHRRQIEKFLKQVK